jgi:hypothetical protein
LLKVAEELDGLRAGVDISSKKPDLQDNVFVIKIVISFVIAFMMHTVCRTAPTLKYVCRDRVTSSLHVSTSLSFVGFAFTVDRRSQSANCRTCARQGRYRPFIFEQNSAAYLETPALFDALSVVMVYSLSATPCF